MVSRFADQKGFDLIAKVAPDLLDEDLAIVVLGAGEAKYEKMLHDWAKLCPGKLSVKVAYDNAIAHKIEAGADMFLMPSRYEPCGLNQIYSLKYGTVPIVRATGGLDDTVEPFDLEHGTGTGFKFAEYSGAAMMYAIRQALHHCTDERIWRRIQLNGMAKDFSWKGPAAEYAKVYEAALILRGVGHAGRNQMSVTTSN
jgi:starch synthase